MKEELANLPILMSETRNWLRQKENINKHTHAHAWAHTHTSQAR